MKKINLSFLAAVLTICCFCAFIKMPLQTWTIDSGYSIRFKGKFADGTFDKLSGTIIFDPSNISASSFNVTVDVASINTGKALKNKHAVSENWFDAEKFPVIRFVSSEVTSTDSSYTVRGELDFHGIKKEILIPFTYLQENNKASFQGSFRVNRADFGIGKTNGKESDFTTVEVVVPVSGT
jgi:polyisoprenoid-binding protein YceI